MTVALQVQIQPREFDYGSHTRAKNVSTSGFSVKIEEETDSSHTAETVSYIAIEPGTLHSGSAKVSETKYYPYGVTQEGGADKYLYTGKELDMGTIDLRFFWEAWLVENFKCETRLKQVHAGFN